MAQLYTYNDTNRWIDVTDVIDRISPKETQLYSGLGKSQALNTYHQWNIDTLATATDNAQIEGQTYSYSAPSVPTRSANITQIFDKKYQVSNTEQAVKQYGISDPISYHQGKKLEEIKNDVELALLRGTPASGTGSAARRLSGVIACISTNATALNSGSSLTETRFNNLAQLSKVQTDKVANEVYTDFNLKRVISSYTAGATKNVNLTDKRLVNSVDVYEGEFGVMKLFAHRYMPGQMSGDTTASVLMLNPDKFKVAFLTNRQFKMEKPAPQGDSISGVIIGELTLESLNEAASVYASGFLNSAP